AGLALHRKYDGWHAVGPVGALVVLNAVEHAAQLFEPHRRAVAICDYERTIRRRAGELALGLDRECPMFAVERAGRNIDVGALDRLRDLIDTDSPRGEFFRIELDTHRIFLRAVHLHLGDAAHHRDALGQVGLRVLVDLR